MLRGNQKQEATTMESQGTAAKRSPHSWQLERACAQQRRPSIAKTKLIKTTTKNKCHLLRMAFPYHPI